jgi:orotidine-5'-phosphate decarboxylase
MAPVLSANANFDVKKIRLIIPDDMPILLAGVGAQGGSLSNLKQLLNSAGLGVFVNSSRGILYNNRGDGWRDSIDVAVKQLRKDLNDARK